MPNFGYGWFAAIGALAAFAPLIIHLLNRRRFRVVEWAAMDFLLHATRRSRRILNLRDILLLLLRTACVLLFAFALARPYFTSTAENFDPDKPVHAVLIVDNSLSMGYWESNSHTLLELAKEKGREFIERLPEGSRISVIPLFGTPGGHSRDAFRSAEDATEQLERIETVDQGVTDAGGLIRLVRDEAVRAQEQVPEMAAATRVVFLGDQQKVNWANWTPEANESKTSVPDIQVVDISPSEASNTWVADLRPQDVVVVAGAKTTLTATIRHEGTSARPNVEVILNVDGQKNVERKHLDSLEPGSSTEVQFDYRIEKEVEGNSAAFVSVEVEIVAPDDQLAEDNSRHVVVPIVSSVPVLFIDQYGNDEDPSQSKHGETLRLRVLMETNLADDEMENTLVASQQATIDELSEALLADKRLVVIAGVESPTPEAVRLLNEYVRQGGQLVLAAGGDFDPVQWNTTAWADGEGILPAPLASEPVGRRLNEPSSELLVPLFIDFKSLRHDYFMLPGNDRDSLKALYADPKLLFSKAIAVDESDELRESLNKTLTDQTIARLKFLAESDVRQREWNDLDRQGQLTEEQVALRNADEAQRQVYEPQWLGWARGKLDEERPHGEDEEGVRAEAERIASSELPRTIARFTDGTPMFVERQVGRGRVLFFASGIAPDDWNTLAKIDAVVMFDRIFRSLVSHTLPRHNFETIRPIELPVAAKDRDAQFVVTAPGGEPQAIDGEYLRADVFGLVIKDVTRRGIYRVTALEPNADVTDDPEAPGVRWQIPLAVGRPERVDDQHSESELLPIAEKDFHEKTGDDSPFTWVAMHDTISLEGGQVSGQDLWWWLIVLVFVSLLVEWLVIAWPKMAREESE